MKAGGAPPATLVGRVGFKGDVGRSMKAGGAPPATPEQLADVARLEVERSMKAGGAPPATLVTVPVACSMQSAQ